MCNKIFCFIIIFFIFCKIVVSQPLFVGFSYGKNFAYATTLMQAMLAKNNEKKFNSYPKNEYSFRVQYYINGNNSFILESRLIERETSFRYYEMVGSYLNEAHYYLKNLEILVKYSYRFFTLKKKIFFHFHLLTGYSYIIASSIQEYNDTKPRNMLIGYGLNISYPAFKQKFNFFISTSLSHLSIKNLYNIDCNIGVMYNFNKNKKEGIK